LPRRQSGEESGELPGLLFGQLLRRLSGEELGEPLGKLQGPLFRELLRRVLGESPGKQLAEQSPKQRGREPPEPFGEQPVRFPDQLPTSVQDRRFREDVSLPRFCPFDFAQGRLRGRRVHRAKDKGRSTKDKAMGKEEGEMAKSGHSSFPLSSSLLSFVAGCFDSWLLPFAL